MGVIIEDIRISNEFRAETTDYLLGNIGDKVTIEVDFRVEEWTISVGQSYNDDDVSIIIEPVPHEAGEIDSTNLIYSQNPDAFVNFRVGDIIEISGSIVASNDNTWEVTEKINDQKIRVIASGHGGSLSSSFMNDGGYIAIVTDFQGITYKWNFIGNEDTATYNNLIDGKLNQLKADGVDNTDTVTQVPLAFDLPTTNNIGSAYVVGNGSTATAQKFTIVHETIITPFFLAEQYSDFVNGIAPSYYLNANALKYIVEIDAGRFLNDPNFIQTTQFIDNAGNTGWYDENFNGGVTNFAIDSVTYKRADLTVIDAVELVTDDQTVDIVISNTDGVFSDTNTNFTLNFAILPSVDTEYTDNSNTVIENFYFDRAFNVVDGATSVAGDNFGGDEQVIKGVIGTFDNANQITLNATLALSSAMVTDLLSRANKRFVVWVTTQDHAKATEVADKVSLRADFNDFFIDLTDDNLITFDTKALRHYESDPLLEGTTTPIVRTEDDVLMYSTFNIDRLGRETDEILITNVVVDVIAEKADGSEFNLDRTFTQSFAGTQVVNDTQFIDNTVSRPFKMPDADQRKLIQLRRRSDLDTTDLRYYELYYPFLMNWAYWQQLIGVNDDFFDTNEPNNGQNNQWQRYDTFVDWDIYYRVRVNLTKNGAALTYEDKIQLTTFDYNEDTDWDTETIVSLNNDTLASQGTLLIDQTRIKASKTYVGGTPPALVDVEWVIRIEAYEEGGVTDIRFLSSVYDWTQNSWLKSIDASNKVVKTVLGSVYSAEVLIDHSKLPESTNQFKVSARIYNEEALAPLSFCILQEDGDKVLQENHDCIQVEF